MARFWQNTKDRLTTPAQYIQTTDTVSRPMAVMISLVMLFIAIAVIFSIFFVGQWGYDKITGKTSKPANPITGISSGVTTAPKPNNSTNTNSAASTSTGSTAKVTNNGTGSVTVTNNTPPPAKNTQSTQSTNKTTQTAVPNTGVGNLLGVFVVASTLGALAYRSILLKKL